MRNQTEQAIDETLLIRRAPKIARHTSRACTRSDLCFSLAQKKLQIVRVFAFRRLINQGNRIIVWSIEAPALSVNHLDFGVDQGFGKAICPLPALIHKV